jgi:hypothetical protein
MSRAQVDEYLGYKERGHFFIALCKPVISYYIILSRLETSYTLLICYYSVIDFFKIANSGTQTNSLVCD